jgi:hypothetical protein
MSNVPAELGNLELTSDFMKFGGTVPLLRYKMTSRRFPCLQKIKASFFRLH